jgi:hypothetical protein
MMEPNSEKMPFPGFQPLAFGSMFSNPATTLVSLRERPQWFYPLLLAAGYSVAVNCYVIQRIGFMRLFSATLQATGTIDVQAVMETALAHRVQILILQGLSTFASTFLTAFVVATVFWLILEVIGEDVPFKRVLAVVAHVTVLMTVVRESMLALTAAVMQHQENLDLRNPLATNLAFFLHPSSPVVSHLLASLDLVTLAKIYLLALGLSKVSSRLSFRTACILVIVPWGAYLGASLLLPTLP